MRAERLILLLVLVLSTPPRLFSNTSDRADDMPQMVVQLGHSSFVMAVALSPDDRFVLSGGGDSKARLWDTSTGAEIRRFEGNRGNISSVAFSPDGRHIISSSKDRTIRACKVTIEGTEMNNNIDFTDQTSINGDGWMCGAEGELLLWIPPPHRSSLIRPSDVWIVCEHETRLDFSSFMHGSNWATCYNLS